ncbi:hypothetical protein AA0X95_17380 [Bacillus sp. 1P10SD]
MSTLPLGKKAKVEVEGCYVYITVREEGKSRSRLVIRVLFP